VKIWIGRGWLRYGGQGSALHSTRIPEPSVKRFLKEHPEEYRLARVDEAWFKGMLFTAFGVNMNAPKNPRVVTVTGHVKIGDTTTPGANVVRVRFELIRCVVAGQNTPRVIGVTNFKPPST
jgi:hypothetical protein